VNKTERDEKLEALREAVNTFVDDETDRLKVERNFLQSVLDASAEAAVERSGLLDEVNAINSLRELVGIDP